jgi:uncharacterized protein YlzI (FlbEa/FlbD family)
VRLVKITETEWINPDHVTGVRDEGDGTVIYLRNGKKVFLPDETAHVIARRINECST